MSSNQMPPQDHIAAHRHSIYHASEIKSSERCGCFYCLEIFEPCAVKEWTDTDHPGSETALCPNCGIDSVIGSQSGYPIEKGFLKRMQRHWF